MTKLAYVSDVFLDDFKTNFNEKYLPLYLNENKKEIRSIFSAPENLIESSIEFECEELVLESTDPDASKKNVKIIWEALKHLSISEASSEKIWVALENTYFLDYHMDQIKLIKSKNREKNIASRTIFNNGKKRSLIINSLASLWWIAYYTIDEGNPQNKYYYTDRFIEGSYRGNAVAFFSSNLVSNKEIVLGALGAIFELVDSKKMSENRYSYAGANKILNLKGGVVILDSLNREEIKKIVKSNLLKVNGVRVIEK